MNLMEIMIIHGFMRFQVCEYDYMENKSRIVAKENIREGEMKYGANSVIQHIILTWIDTNS